MSAVADPVAPMTAPPVLVSAPPSPSLTPAEFVRGLPAEFKRAVLAELVREIGVATGQKGVVPVRTAADEWVGNLVLPEEPAAKADREFFEFAPEMRDAIMKGYLDLDLENTYTLEELTARTTAGASLQQL